jgi:hypothetical protein
MNSLVLHISTSYTLYTSIYCWLGIVNYFIFLQAIHSTPQYIEYLTIPTQQYIEVYNV